MVKITTTKIVMDKKAKLHTENPELLIYLDGKLHITILGGIKLTGLDRLKVTLKLIRTDNKQNAFRHNLDLYNSIQTEQLIEKSAETLDVSTNEISQAINNLTTALENYRAERLEAMKPKQPEKKTLTEAEPQVRGASKGKTARADLLPGLLNIMAL